MDRTKTLLKYGVWVALFFIFSNILIYISLETTYRNIERKDSISQVIIYQAQATKISGRIKGKIENSSSNVLEGKYLKIDFYSARDNLLGTEYIDISTLKENQAMDLELHFKLRDVEYYVMSFADEMFAF